MNGACYSSLLIKCSCQQQVLIVLQVLKIQQTENYRPGTCCIILVCVKCCSALLLHYGDQKKRVCTHSENYSTTSNTYSLEAAVFALPTIKKKRSTTASTTNCQPLPSNTQLAVLMLPFQIFVVGPLLKIAAKLGLNMLTTAYYVVVEFILRYNLLFQGSSMSANEIYTAQKAVVRSIVIQEQGPLWQKFDKF